MDNTLTPAQRNAILSRIKPGMDVMDADGSKVGSVEFVHMADENELLADQGNQDTETGLLEGLADAFSGSSGTDVTERMLQVGYVKIDSAGLFTGDTFVVPGQVAEVDEHVHLNVLKDNIGHPS